MLQFLNAFAWKARVRGARSSGPPVQPPLFHPFLLCAVGAGSSGAVVARRLAEDKACTVLLLEAGGDDIEPKIQ